MSSPRVESLDQRAERLAIATADVRPRAGFHHAVMAAVLAEPTGWWSFITPLGRRALPVLLVLTLLTTLAAVEAHSSVDEALAVAYGSAEVEW